MEKINVAELLKDCPKGMELYSPIFGKVYLDKIRPHLAIVVITDKEQGDFREEFLYDGRYGTNGECMLFPSKGKTTWEGFVPPCQFKDGDVFVESSCIFIIQKLGDNNTAVKTYCTLYGDGIFDDGTILYFDIDSTKPATEEEKQKLFNAIKANGYRWNAETKTLEKLPRFKVGDRIVDIYRKHLHCDSASGKISQITDDKYIFTDGSYIFISNQDNWELVPNKFDITTLKPFDKLLVRHNKDNKWSCSFFSHIDKDLHSHCYKFVTTSGKSYPMCIPYEGNEHLIGKTDDCDEYFNIWKK